MNDTKNFIAKASKVYENLLEAYNSSDPVERFLKCFEILEKADYLEVHFAITMLKEINSKELPSSDNALVNSIIKLATTCTSSTVGRRAYLLDMLEEARERKRDNYNK